MEQYIGKSIYSSIAIGKLLFYEQGRQQVKRYKVHDVEAEIDRYERAKDAAKKQMKELYETALSEVGEANARIFEIHAMLMEDEEYNESVYSMIRDHGVNAECAVADTKEHFSALFSEMEDEYLKARVEDVADVSQRLLEMLTGEAGQEAFFDEPVILVTKSLAPSELVRLDKKKLQAFVTKYGSSNSHTAILARTMSIPALTGVDIMEAWNGKRAILDGKQGKLIIDPDVKCLEFYEEQMRKEDEERSLLMKLKGKKDITKGGREIRLNANIGSLSDVALVLENDANGIGLFRSEFLYLERQQYPTEEEQFLVYKAVARNMAGKKVIIRTLDIGADKQAGYFELEPEENPAMGYRAIRICLERVDLFKTQLRAIYRASAYGNISILFPMIISLKEVHAIKNICEEVKTDLNEAGVRYGQVELGIMVETPAAVLISDLLAGEVDFLSIGTNDLTQYTLALDRQNLKLEPMYDPYHPAVLRMIQMVVENGHREGCPVSICGELAADTTLTGRFVEMGVDELSVPPHMILPIRRILREME